ncbi:MAG: carboxylesterase/lipase family protein [Polyangiaceae bacterium]
MNTRRRPSILVSLLAPFLLLAGVSGCSSSSSNASAGDGGGSGSEGGSASGLDVMTDKGMVHGSSAKGVRAFLGIPFADTTGGVNRWKPPQPAKAWTTTLDATQPGPICPQINPSSMSYDANSDENCLSVNVWTPDPAPAKPLPVMVWIYGGAYVFGSGAAAPYSGDHLVPGGNVVVVSMNYRVGPLGFMAHSALAAQDPSHSTGNYGLLDQQAAFKWVQTNIAAFGGDKTDVTLFGESAGANSLCLHMLAPSSQGLFTKAIVESGLCLLPVGKLADAEAEGDRFATAMGCTGTGAAALTCLAGKSAKDITSGPASPPAMQPGGFFYQDPATTLSFKPIEDGTFLTGEPAALFSTNKGAKVPVLQGTNTNEGILFHVPALGPYTPVMTSADYLGALTRTFGAGPAATIAAYYSVSGGDAGAPAGDGGAAPGDAGAGAMTFATYNDALTKVSSDAFFVCQARRLEQWFAANGQPTYLYSFNGPLSAVPLMALAGQAFHSSELPYVFGDNYVLGSVPDAGAPLVGEMEGYWTRFATTGDPNGGSAPMWPPYAAATDQNINLDTTTTVDAGLEKSNCDFWDHLVAANPSIAGL